MRRLIVAYNPNITGYNLLLYSKEPGSTGHCNHLAHHKMQPDKGVERNEVRTRTHLNSTFIMIPLFHFPWYIVAKKQQKKRGAFFKHPTFSNTPGTQRLTTYQQNKHQQRPKKTTTFGFSFGICAPLQGA